jgi:electron-transferring-flavoprotein dehydrogenase
MLGSCFLLPSSPSFYSSPSQTADSTAPLSLTAYTASFLNSPAYNDLWAVRNVRPAFNTRLGVFGGVTYAGVDTMVRGRVPWTLRHHGRDGVSVRAFIEIGR